MKAKHVWWSVAALLTAGAVAATAGVGVAVHNEYKDLSHGEPLTVAEPTAPLQPLGAPEGEADAAAIAARLDGVLADADLGEFSARVTDTTTGDVVWDHDADRALLPASATKVLTTAAATLELGEDHRITTEVVAGKVEGNVVIKAAGDVWLTDKQIEDLAKELEGEQVNGVFVDTSAWGGKDFNPGWERADIDGGFIAPLKPVMRFGARLGEPGRSGELTGDMPRSHTPALDVAQRLGQRLGAESSGFAPAPADAKVLASTRSARLDERTQDMVKHSDNIAAEAIARELAIARGEDASFEGATAATLAVLEEHGIPTDGVRLTDNCGLSKNNRIPAATLDAIVAAAVEQPELRPLLGYLPVAGGEGTLADRYDDRAGLGYVRAKTGTLTGTSALSGTAVGKSGRVYSFGMVSNDSDVLAARAGLDDLASALREF